MRDRGANADGLKVRFNPSLVPSYLRKAKSVKQLLPWLYLKRISTVDFSETRASLVGLVADGFKLLSNLVVEVFGLSRASSCFIGFNSIFGFDASDDFGETIKAT